MRNTQATLEQSFKTVIETQNLCLKHNKKLVVYISMAFGNPYQDAYHPSIVSEWIDKLSQEGITHFSLADTVAIANHQSIKQLFETVIPEFAQCTIGAHLHTTQANWQQNIHAAIQAGCTVWDSAIGGIGGCPMATDTLSGNLATENLLDYITQQKISHSLNTQALSQCITLSKNIFQKKEGS
jgi:hydroxymethylglutaryl-CoA lyase